MAKQKKNATKEDFIKEIRDWMHKRGHTQYAAAATLNVTPACLSEVLNKEQRTIPKTILDFFGRNHKVEIKESYPLVAK